MKKALAYFEQAQKINPETELINFYLGHVYLKLGNAERAKMYLDKSAAIKEYNDPQIA